jgi:aspartate aminotransferase-like enzyme
LKILVSGSRYYKNYRKILSFLTRMKQKHSEVIVVEGGARGADTLARKACEKLNIKCKEYNANWEKYGRAAGPIRNQQMLDDNDDIEIVAIFHEELNKSKGTKDMLKRARKANKEIVKFN